VKANEHSEDKEETGVTCIKTLPRTCKKKYVEYLEIMPETNPETAVRI
jgi:hypothetical protein